MGDDLETEDLMISHHLKKTIAKCIEYNSFAESTILTNLYTEWYAHIRDYNHIGARIKEFDNPGGQKVVIVGQSHVNRLVHYLQTNQMDTPRNWTEFRDARCPKEKYKKV